MYRFYRDFYRVLAAIAAILGLLCPVTAAAQTPQPPVRERETLGSTISVDALGELPASANVLSLLDAAQADLISDRLDTGGLSTGVPARAGAHGSTWTQTQIPRRRRLDHRSAGRWARRCCCPQCSPGNAST